MNWKTFPLTRMGYLDDIQELGLKLLHPVIQLDTFKNASHLARDPEITLGRTLEPRGTCQPYNCTRHKSTGFSPFLLLFGHHPCLSVDLMFGTEGQINQENHPQYVEKWRRAMSEAYELARKKCSEVGARAKQRYDHFA